MILFNLLLNHYCIKILNFISKLIVEKYLNYIRKVSKDHVILNIQMNYKFSFKRLLKKFFQQINY
jgi:hypothetical protein